MPEEHLLNLISNDEIKVSIPDFCNDPLEFIAAGSDGDVGNKMECGFICLSSHFKSSLMWSHYADSHKGVCLQFDFPIRQTGKIQEPNKANWINFTHNQIRKERQETRPITDFAVLDTNEHISSSQFFSASNSENDKAPIIVKVHYTDHRPHKGKVPMYASFNEDGIEELGLETCIYTKSLEWNYENEWRIFVDLNNAQNFHDHAFFATGLTQYITRIIVGTKFPKRCGLLEHYITQASKKSPNQESKAYLRYCLIERAAYHPEKYEIILG